MAIILEGVVLAIIPEGVGGARIPEGVVLAIIPEGVVSARILEGVVLARNPEHYLRQAIILYDVVVIASTESRC